MDHDQEAVPEVEKAVIMEQNADERRGYVITLQGDDQEAVPEVEKRVIIEEDVDGRRSYLITLEDKLDQEQEKLLLASCSLLKIYPSLDDDEYAGIERSMGWMDFQKFYHNCLSHKESEEETEEETLARAHQLRNLWIGKMISAYDVPEEERGDVPFKPYNVDDLEAVKETFGEDLYRTIRKAFREVRVAFKTGVEYKPWNRGEGREATLNELLDALPKVARPPSHRRR
ncbi:hypothetical protein Bca4012_003286 [Brassica carinata]|nr:uncharacterized protein BNACNNG15930D [Brassica napus]KAF3594267.1 hypothetical protein DY000_02024526 [Brassica cretica]KAG2297482.1 hypothetical protein Bca52824_044151 [Brassica carinata]VDC91747.1 unnamed protein product [Brassica oleracea]CAF1702616.1 unnamed protein product [Brassica napus]CDY48202.1 BnaCnng15930D [Brassica napus]